MVEALPIARRDAEHFVYRIIEVAADPGGEYEKWDSLAHVKLIMALEDEFGISFTIGEMTSLESVADIKKLLSTHGAN
jgi:acyl carrier protein